MNNFTNSEKYSKVYSKLQQLLKDSPKLLFLGIGENRMGDDGIGQWISFKLSMELESPNICIINGGIVPEERLDEMVEFQPELMIVIDAAEIDKKPGEMDLYEESQMLNYLPISSHTMPLPIFIDRCKQKIPGVKIFLLGIKPISMQFLDTYQLFQEDVYSLDDKDENLNIPFYEFNLTKEMEEIAENLIFMFKELTREY